MLEEEEDPESIWPKYRKKFEPWSEELRAYMDEHLKDARNEPPAIDLHLCRFGQWLDADGQNRYGAHADFWRIDHLHRQVHSVAKRLTERRNELDPEASRSGLDELHGLRDQLLARLQMLLQNGRQ